MFFRGKRIVITGGTSGIGLTIAQRFGMLGAKVAMLGRDSEKGQRAQEAVGNGAIFLECDISNPVSVADVFEHIVQSWDGVDLAVNNAGVTTPYVEIPEIDPEDWNRAISINLSGVLYAMKAEIPLIRRRPGGAIVNVSSCIGVVPMRNQAAYVASKAAVNALTAAAALECAVDQGDHHAVRINAVAPGPTLGGMNRPERLAANPVNTERKRNSTAMRRFAEPEEIADVVEWLLSPRSSFLTGTVLNADGGYSTGKML